MSEPDQKKLYEDATKIVMRLQDDADDPQALKEKEDFLARGEAARAVYQKVLKAWELTGLAPEKAMRDRKRTNFAIALLAAALVTGYLMISPLRIALNADYQTARAPEHISLKSGDRLTLDASSAVIDDTDGGDRVVNLLSGAAFFDVEPKDRAFIVAVDDVRVQVLGTSFAVTRLSAGVGITVTHGRVKVIRGNRSWTLSRGDRLTLSGAGSELREIVDPSKAAPWRTDQLSVDGMTLSRVADILDRRMPARIIVLGETLETAKVTGVLDLRTPDLSLQTLVSPYGGRVVSITPFLKVVFPAR